MKGREVEGSTIGRSALTWRGGPFGQELRAIRAGVECTAGGSSSQGEGVREERGCGRGCGARAAHVLIVGVHRRHASPPTEGCSCL